MSEEGIRETQVKKDIQTALLERSEKEVKGKQDLICAILVSDKFSATEDYDMNKINRMWEKKEFYFYDIIEVVKKELIEGGLSKKEKMYAENRLEAWIKPVGITEDKFIFGDKPLPLSLRRKRFPGKVFFPKLYWNNRYYRDPFKREFNPEFSIENYFKWKEAILPENIRKNVVKQLNIKMEQTNCQFIELHNELSKNLLELKNLNKIIKENIKKKVKCKEEKEEKREAERSRNPITNFKTWAKRIVEKRVKEESKKRAIEIVSYTYEEKIKIKLEMYRDLLKKNNEERTAIFPTLLEVEEKEEKEDVEEETKEDVEEETTLGPKSYPKYAVNDENINKILNIWNAKNSTVFDKKEFEKEVEIDGNETRKEINKEMRKYIKKAFFEHNKELLKKWGQPANFVTFGSINPLSFFDDVMYEDTHNLTEIFDKHRKNTYENIHKNKQVAMIILHFGMGQ